MTQRVDRPIFVIGTGRCGLSLVVDLLAQHAALAWFSQWTDKFPASRWAPSVPYWYRKPLLKQLFDVAGLVTGRNVKPHPDECFRAFERHFRGFARPYRPLTRLDLDHGARRGITATVLEHIRAQRRERFIAELSGWARIAFLREVFPDAKFIHVVRDPRPTVNSLLNVDWWDGWRGEMSWRWGEIPAKYRGHLNNGSQSFAALAGIHYNILIDNILTEAAELGEGQYLETRFEDVVSATERQVRRLAEFAELEYTPAFDRAWRAVRVFDPNNRRMRIAPWRENLTAEQQALVARVCGEHIRRFSYPLEER